MKRTVLLAVGDPVLLNLAVRLFRWSGYEVDVASGGLECLMKLREGRPDALVLDAGLPWGGGAGVLSLMDDEYHSESVHVVLIENGGRESPRARWDSPAVVARLAQPFPLNRLLEAVGRATRRPEAVFLER